MGTNRPGAFPLRVLICGSRKWVDIKPILRELQLLENIDCLIEGEALGADTLARQAAESLNIPVSKFPADWKTFGKTAGPIRNRQMLLEGKPDLVLAFHPCLEQSLGTKNMVNQAKAKGITVKVISS